jgi:hypothetical protein
MDFDHERIAAADKKEELLFQWLSQLERELLDADNVTELQPTIEKDLFRYINTPLSSKLIRELISNCFLLIYSKGDGRTVFDTLSSLQAILASKKLDENVKLYGLLI